jgi:hypothetical protein
MEPLSKPRPHRSGNEPKLRSRPYGGQRYRDYLSLKKNNQKQSSGLGFQRRDSGTSDEVRVEAIIGHEKIMEVISLIESEGGSVTIPESRNPNTKWGTIEQASKDQIEKIFGHELAEEILAILPANFLNSRAFIAESVSSSDSMKLFYHIPIISQTVNTSNETAITDLYARCTPASKRPFMSIRRDTLDNGTVVELVHYSAEYVRTLESPCNSFGILQQGLAGALGPRQLVSLIQTNHFKVGAERAAAVLLLILAVVALSFSIFLFYAGYQEQREGAKRVEATRKRVNKKAECGIATTSLSRQEQADVACIYEKVDTVSGQRA